jgi:carboxymethylenebutenolidase
MCLGGHLAFRCAFDKRIRAAVCYFATDIHSQTLGHGKNDDSIKRVKDINGELIMVRSPKKKKSFLPTSKRLTHHLFTS